MRECERTADHYVGRIVAACEKLRRFPQRGTKRDEILPGLRTVGFERRATIAVVVEAGKVIVEGIFHGGRDFEAALRDESREFPSPEDR